MRSLTFIALIALFLPCAPLAVADDLPAIVVRADALGRQRAQGRNPGLLVAMHRDGTVIWSKDQNKGGGPFLTARIDAAKVDELLQRWSREIELNQKKFQRGYLGPDSSYHEVSLQLAKERIKLTTWHELYEANPNIVALPGLTPLDGRTREEALKSAPKDFLRFREVWKDVRTSIAALVPEKGEPYEGEVVLSTKVMKNTKR